MTGEPGGPGTLTFQNPTIRKGFTALPNAVMDMPISVYAKYLYAVLMRHAWRTGECYPGWEALQREMGCGRRQVGLYLRELEAADLLRSKRRGLGKTNMYVLLDAPVSTLPEVPQRNFKKSRSTPEELQEVPHGNFSIKGMEEESLEEEILTPSGVTPAILSPLPADESQRSLEPEHAPPKTWQAALFEAFEQRGLPPPSLHNGEGRDAKYLCQKNDPDLIAQCWQDYVSGRYGDPYDQRILSFSHLVSKQRFNNWLLWKAGKIKAPARGGYQQAPAAAYERREWKRPDFERAPAPPELLSKPPREVREPRALVGSGA